MASVVNGFSYCELVNCFLSNTKTCRQTVCKSIKCFIRTPYWFIRTFLVLLARKHITHLCHVYVHSVHRVENMTFSSVAKLCIVFETRSKFQLPRILCCSIADCPADVQSKNALLFINSHVVKRRRKSFAYYSKKVTNDSWTARNEIASHLMRPLSNSAITTCSLRDACNSQTRPFQLS